MMNSIALFTRSLLTVASLLVSSTLLAQNFNAPTNVRIEGDRLLWDPVEDAGGYNIYWNYGYLATVKDSAEYRMQFDGLYQVVAFDPSASLFSSQFADGVEVTYEVGDQQDSPESLIGRPLVKVFSVTCDNVGPGETCTASCLVPGEFRMATGGACSTSDIVEADATASQWAYSCTVPTFSGEVTAQVYCLDREVR